MIGALAYLLGKTWRNHLTSMARRLRSPRYAIGMVLGLAYLWLLFGRHAFSNAGRAGLPNLASPFEAIAPALVLMLIGGVWLFGGDKSALVFTEAEVSMLLTAPISRRTLIGYKLARSQLAILINVVIWVFLLGRRSSSLPAVFSAAGLWVIFTTLNLHRMGVALSRASQVEYRAAGQFRKWAGKMFAFVVVMALTTAIAVGAIGAVHAPEAGNPFSFLTDIVSFLQSPGARRILYPFHLVTAPAFATSVDAWAAAMLPALAIVLAHVWWVMRSDAAFEEAAALASTQLATRLAAMRTRRTTLAAEPKVAAKGTIALSSSGAPVVAIVWKNAIALRRTFQSGGLLRMLVPVLVITGVLNSHGGDTARFVARLASTLG